jgi:hypothetical protein
MYNFGAGVLIGVPTYDANGNAISNPTPIQFGTLQEVTVDEEWESKPLYGALQFPVAYGRGKGKVTLKCKAALINAELWNAFAYGLTLASTYQNVYEDLTGTLVPTSPYQIVTTSVTGNMIEDLGVRDGNSIPYTRVASSPTAGQYSYLATAAQYTFSNLSQGNKVFINYAYASTGVASSKSLSVTNLPMGYSPFFECHLRTQWNGKTMYVKYPNAVSNKLSRTFKNDDWAIPEFDIDCFADSNGNISSLYAYE